MIADEHDNTKGYVDRRVRVKGSKSLTEWSRDGKDDHLIDV